MGLKIMFLDIDGVVCTLRSQYAYGDGLLMQAWDITACQMIRRLCIANGYQIVCSSTWRNHNHTKTYFAVYGLIELLHDDWKTPREPSIRGNEIALWMTEHTPVDEYVIIDDDSDMTNEQMDRLVLVNSHEGFSADNFEWTDKLMGGGYRKQLQS